MRARGVTVKVEVELYTDRVSLSVGVGRWWMGVEPLPWRWRLGSASPPYGVLSRWGRIYAFGPFYFGEENERLALVAEIERLQREVDSWEESHSFYEERRATASAREERRRREAEDEADRLKREADDREYEQRRLLKDLEWARSYGDEYSERRIIEKLRRL